LADINETLNFLINFQKISAYQILIKSVQWELSCSMQTNKHNKLNSHFVQFYEST